MSANEFLEGLSIGRPMTGTLVQPTPGEKRKREIMLGRMLQSFNPAAPVDPSIQQAQRLRNEAMAKALQGGDMTRPTVSGSILEGLARGGEAFFNARAARDQAQTAADEKAKAEAEKRARNDALAAALRASSDPTLTPEQRQQAGITAMGSSPDLAPDALKMQLGGLQGQIDRTNKIADAKELGTFGTNEDLRGRGFLVGDGGAMSMAPGGPAATQQANAEAALRLDRQKIGADQAYRNQMLGIELMKAQRGDGARDRVTEAYDKDALNAAKDARQRAQVFSSAAQQFMTLNQRQDTGITAPVGKMFSGDLQAMDALTNQIAPMMRQPGSGAVSDKDMAIFMTSVPNIGTGRQANTAIALAMVEAGKNAAGYADFLERTYQQRGTTMGADAAWQQYLNANPIYDAKGAVRQNRPSYDAWVQAVTQKQAEIDKLKAGK